jgi:hypothetical protein
MFDDPTLIGPWAALTTHLDTDGVLVRWKAEADELADLTGVDELMRAWADPARTHSIAAGLIRLAAADGGRDDDALLLLLHLLSGVVWRLTAQLADLSPDITALVLSELTCQIRSYRWHARPGGLVTNLEWDTRRAVLAELRPSDRYHPDRVEQLTDNGIVYPTHCLAFADPNTDQDEDDLDLVDLLLWAAAAAGVDEGDLRLLLESECAPRGQRGGRADERVAQSHGITRRHLLRRRQRALTALRAVAPAYLAAVSAAAA